VGRNNQSGKEKGGRWINDGYRSDGWGLEHANSKRGPRKDRRKRR